MLDQSFRTCIRLTNLALSPIEAEEPVVAQRVCVLLLRDPDTLSRLFLEALQALPGAPLMCAPSSRTAMCPPRGCDPTTTFDCRDHVAVAGNPAGGYRTVARSVASRTRLVAAPRKCICRARRQSPPKIDPRRSSSEIARSRSVSRKVVKTLAQGDAEPAQVPRGDLSRARRNARPLRQNRVVPLPHQHGTC